MKPQIAFIYSDWDVNEYRRTHDLYGGIGYYRIHKPAQVLSKWFDIDVIGADFQKWGTTEMKYDRLGRQYDLIFSKSFRTPQDASNTLAVAKHFKKKIVVDIDDNYFEIRKDNPASADYEYGNGPREFMSAYVSLANGVTVSTVPLKQAYKSLNKKIDVLPNCNDINDWPKERKVWNDGKVRIGFAGGRGHNADLEMILEPMAYILAKYPNVQFDIVGALDPTEIMQMTVKMNEFCKKNISEQVRLAGGTLAWQGYPEMLAGFGWDIGICPLVQGGFNRSKSHIKFMEYSMVGAAVVASPEYPFKEPIQGVDVITDEKTGLFAKDKEEWYAMLEGLITHPEARKELASNAYTHIKEHWQYGQWGDKFKKAFDKYLK